MSRSEVISREAEGMTIALRAIHALLSYDELRGRRAAAICNTSVTDRTQITLRILPPTHDRTVVKQRIVEVGVRPRCAGELVQVETNLPPAVIRPAAESADQATRRCIKQNSSTAKAETQHGLGDVVADTGKRTQI